MFKTFIAGGVFIMSLLTVELIVLLLAAWKAPAWVRGIGRLALVSFAVYALIGLVNAFACLSATDGDVSPSILFGGLHVLLIQMCYALIIYGISLLIHLFQKPRI